MNPRPAVAIACVALLYACSTTTAPKAPHAAPEPPTGEPPTSLGPGASTAPSAPNAGPGIDPPMVQTPGDTTPIDTTSNDTTPNDPPGSEPPDATPSSLSICGVDTKLAALREAQLVIDVATYLLVAPGNTQTPTIVPVGPAAGLDWVEHPTDCIDRQCFERDSYIESIFGHSSTSFTMLVGMPYALGFDGTSSQGFEVINNEDLVDGSLSIQRRLGEQRVLAAPAVMPNDRFELQAAAMERWSSLAHAWLLDTAWSPTPEGGFWLDDPIARGTLEHGVALGVDVFLVRKGVSWGLPAMHGDPRDVGPAARAVPAARIVVLQSAFEFGLTSTGRSRPPSDPTVDEGWGPGVGRWPEGPYDESDPAVRELHPLDRGVNALIKSLRDHGIGPGQNVYASLDGVWAELWTRPIEAAHVLGKLLLYVGEDNILWGTQSPFYGTPEVQIQAFRAFEIPHELRERHGYPELTEDVKHKILGRNAARLLRIGPEPGAFVEP